jgi:hypothetical protein
MRGAAGESRARSRTHIIAKGKSGYGNPKGKRASKLRRFSFSWLGGSLVNSARNRSSK